MELFMGAFSVLIGRMDIACGRLQGFVAEKDLNGGGIRALLGKVCREAVAE